MINNLASILMDQQRFNEAESLFRKVLAIQQQTPGADHPVSSERRANLESLQDASRAVKREGGETLCPVCKISMEKDCAGVEG